MDSNEFYDWVRKTLNRGNTLDDVIQYYVRAAVRHIERKNPFEELAWWASFTLTKDTDQIINLPSRLRDIVFLRIDTNEEDGAEENWEYVTRSYPKNLINRKGKPQLFWTNERGCLVLDALPDKDYPAELKVHRFTEFPAMGAPDGTGHWLLDHGPDVLHARVMYMMAPYYREDDPNMVQTWLNMAREGEIDLITEDNMSKEAGVESVMTYWPAHIPLDKGFRDVSEDN